MISYIWPLVLIVLSNTVYHLASKSTPENANAFLSLVITYTIGALASLILYFTTGNHSFVNDLKVINWTSLLLGLAIVGLEAGWIFMYRAGWKISMGSLTANILLAVVLFVIGALAYKEVITVKQIIGSLICVVGLVIMNL